mmetsp:Transcript_772/g.1501  ORF Transcript_772/g.1501 Transcript_772/m.1501 type:complete len:184 (-) Transcript_772:1130-1681(-)
MHKQSQHGLSMWLQGENWIKLAAQKRHVPAMFYMGYIMETHYHDTEAARHWYTQAADQGDAQATFKLATLQPKDSDTYLELMKAAAELGLPEAMHNLGDIYKKRNDPVKSVAWFLAAAKNHFYPSIINVALIFLNGEGPVISNPLAAKVWLEKAKSMQDSPDVQAMLEAADEAIIELRANISG